MIKSIGTVLGENKWQDAINISESERLLCRPGCEVCGGIGFVHYDVPIGHEYFGKAFTCPKLPPESSIYDGHGLEIWERQSLNFSKVRNRENVSDGIKALRKVLKLGKGFGYLYGGPGLAKTMLLKILCAEWARTGRGVFHFCTQKDFIDEMRVCFDDDEPQRAIREKQAKYKGFPLLALDEITIDRSTPFLVDEFFNLINKRHEEGTEKGKPFLTVIAGNISPRQLDYRIADRLTDKRNFVVQLTGESYRPFMQAENHE
jgi:hypothetical protein